MDFKIYFCVDGILRAKFSDDKPLIPIKFLQDNSEFKNNDLRFWCRWWENNVFFEDGVTIGAFLRCLEPWANFWTDITGKNVQEYINECRRPYIVNEKDNGMKLDWISLSYYTEAEPKVEYHKDSDEELERDINAWLNSPKKTRLTGEWHIYSCYKLTGYVNGKEEQYAIEYTPMNELANVKFVLNDQQWLYFDDWQLKSFFDKEVVFRKSAFGLCEAGKKHKVKFMIGEKYHKMRDVVEGFFWWMYATPSRREDFVESLKETKEELDLFLKEEKKSKDNVVSLFKKEECEKEEQPTTAENGEDEIKEVKIAPGAFDSMIQSYDRDKNYWDLMLDLASKNNNVVLRIGSVETNQPPEKRVFGYIVDPEDKSGNPTPTRYKLK